MKKEKPCSPCEAKRQARLKKAQEENDKKMELIIVPITIAITSSAFSCFMWHCYQEEEVFSFWGKFLEKLPKFLAEPLGECLVCHSTWWCIFCIVICSITSVIQIMLAIGLNFLFIRLFNKYT